MKDSRLPPGFAPGRIAATIGLVSDTHLPQRRRALPPTLAEIMAGVDMLLHAGDVGELRVLDALSAIAPVVAVHGNDDTAEAQRELPEELVVTAGGRRILLWHSHHPERAEELRLRQDDAWAPKLDRIRRRSRRAGATIAVFGHMHVPLQQEEDGILLVNPGALASGNPYTRQSIQTVALLFLRDDGAAAVRHLDVRAPASPFEAEVAWPAGFGRALAGVSESILAPALAPLVSLFRDGEFADRRALQIAYYRLAHRCWEGRQDVITRADLLAELAGDPAVAAADRATVRAYLDG